MPVKSAAVDARRMYMLIPLASVESAQSKVIVATVDVDPFTGVDSTGTLGMVVSIRTDHVLAHSL